MDSRAQTDKMDLVLSSGFLAFARHVGVLEAIEERNTPIDGICGTSSGALIGALWAAGMPANEIAKEISERSPLSLVRPNWAMWKGALSLQALLDQLRRWLPATFQELPRPFAVGVEAPGGVHRLLKAGPLPESVAASCAVPYLFAPIQVEGVVYRDGGRVDRLGLAPWRQLRGERPTLVHQVERTAGKDTDTPMGNALVINTPPSGAKLWNLGDFKDQQQFAKERALEVLP